MLHGPRVSVIPAQEAEEGGEVVVECRAEAEPPPTSVLWSLAGRPDFHQSGRFLSLANVTHREAGLYTCTVVNMVEPSGQEARRREGNATVKVEVRHAPGPAFIEPVQPVGIEGKSVELRCGASPPGFPAPQYQWWRAGRPQEILGRGASLILRPVRAASAGSYHCQPYNSLGRGSPVAVELAVVQEPRIVTGLPTQVVRRAGTQGLNLTCVGKGRPAPTPTWYRDGQPLAGREGRYYRVEGRDIEGQGGLTVSSTLMFAGQGRTEGGLRHQDSGEFTCQFDNSVGRAQSAVALKVEHAPFLSVVRDKVAADPGDLVLVPCRMAAFPAPHFRWERRGQEVSGAGRVNSRSVRQLSDYEYESVFTVRRVTEESYGEYVCRASNSLGSAMAAVSLVRRGAPETPGSPRTLEVTANSLTVTWRENFNGGMNDTLYLLQWEEQGAAPGSGGERECREAVCGLDKLLQHTTYRVRVRAVNRYGKSQWTEARPFTTQIDVSQVISQTL